MANASSALALRRVCYLVSGGFARRIPYLHDKGIMESRYVRTSRCAAAGAVAHACGAHLGLLRSSVRDTRSTNDRTAPFRQHSRRPVRRDYGVAGLSDDSPGRKLNNDPIFWREKLGSRGLLLSGWNRSVPYRCLYGRILHTDRQISLYRRNWIICSRHVGCGSVYRRRRRTAAGASFHARAGHCELDQPIACVGWRRSFAFAFEAGITLHQGFSIARLPKLLVRVGLESPYLHDGIPHGVEICSCIVLRRCWRRCRSAEPLEAEVDHVQASCCIADDTRTAHAACAGILRSTIHNSRATDCGGYYFSEHPRRHLRCHHRTAGLSSNLATGRCNYDFVLRRTQHGPGSLLLPDRNGSISLRLLSGRILHTES